MECMDGVGLGAGQELVVMNQRSIPSARVAGVFFDVKTIKESRWCQSIDIYVYVNAQVSCKYRPTVEPSL